MTDYKLELGGLELFSLVLKQLGQQVLEDSYGLHGLFECSSSYPKSTRGTLKGSQPGYHDQVAVKRLLISMK